MTNCKVCGSKIFFENSQISGTVKLYFGTTHEAEAEVENTFLNYSMYDNIQHNKPKTCRCATCNKRYLRSEISRED